MCCTEFLCRTKKPREAAHRRRIERTSFLFSWNRGISWQSWDSSMPPTDPKRVFSLTPSWRENHRATLLAINRRNCIVYFTTYYELLCLARDATFTILDIFLFHSLTYVVKLQSSNLSREMITYIIIIDN